MGGGVFSNYYKGYVDKTKGKGGSKGGRWIWLGWGGEVGRKCREPYLNNNKVILKNFHVRHF